MSQATSSVTTQPASAGADTARLSWSVHMLRRDPKMFGRTLLCIASVFLAGIVLFHNVAVASIPAVVLVLSVSEYLFPVRYTLSQRGAAMRCALTWLEMPWADVRHAYLSDDGVKLSPLRATGSRFEPVRGIFLRFSDDNRESVIQLVRELKGTES